MKRQT